MPARPGLRHIRSYRPMRKLDCAGATSPLQIKLRLGHAEIRTTMDTYGHLFPSAEAAMADLLDAG